LVNSINDYLVADRLQTEIYIFNFDFLFQIQNHTKKWTRVPQEERT